VYGLEKTDLVIASLIKTYIEKLTVDDARTVLEKVFPENRNENGVLKIDAPKLAELIKSAQIDAAKDESYWEMSGGSCEKTKELVDEVRTFLIKELDSKEYVWNVPSGLISMLEELLSAIEEATHIYRIG
jgi:hypothetical protein